MKATRKRNWPPIYTDDGEAEARLNVDGVELRRTGGVWMAKTQAETWRSAHWLKVVHIDRTLDLLAEALDQNLAMADRIGGGP